MPTHWRESPCVAVDREFARCRPGGTQVDRIATQAGLNVRMLYFHGNEKAPH
ncbi:MAG: hypothetical protein O2975_08885 [Proteobacteria bacterium]|nr:hypothetical protein [Pseudomonadota bacterium]